jgi:hypothetical protein
VLRAIEGGCAQLFTYDAGRWATPLVAEDPVLRHLRRAAPLDVREYLSAEQATGGVDFSVTNALQRLAVGLSAIALALVLLHPALRGASPPRARALASALVAGVVANALSSGALGSPVDRYQSRVVWLIVLAALLACADRVALRVARAAEPAPGLDRTPGIR